MKLYGEILIVAHMISSSGILEGKRSGTVGVDPA